MMRCLRLSSLLILLCWVNACKSPYKALQPVSPAAATSVLQYKPVFEKELYRCVVDGRFLLKSFRLTGILLLKQFPDSSTRVLFQNEMGFSFFDFGWDGRDSFVVHHIIPQMDKPAVIRTLEKDIRLLLMRGLDSRAEQYFAKEDWSYHYFPQPQGGVYYLEQHRTLSRIEIAGKRKPVAVISLSGKRTTQALPDSVFIRHHRAGFTIQLHKITSHASE